MSLTWFSTTTVEPVIRLNYLDCLITKPVCLHLKVFFTMTGPKLWDLLPKDIKCVSDFTVFKNKLNKFLLKFPDCPPVTGYKTINYNSIIDWKITNNSIK